MTIQDMVARWEERRTEWARFGAHLDGKRIAEQVLSELMQCAVESGATTLTLRQAALKSGYSPDHLAKLVRAGTIPNAGKKGSPRICVEHLPIRPRIALDRRFPYDPAADARRLQVRR